MTSIKHPEWLYVKSGEDTYYGFDQNWYEIFFRRMAGCGPVSATMQLIYLNERDSLGLPYKNENGKAGVLDALNDVWNYVTPSIRGLHTLRKFEEGVTKLTREKGISFTAHKLSVFQTDRPSEDEVKSFIEGGLESDIPVAFLNWNNGGVEGLDTWHWIVIVSIDGNIVTCFDQGNRISFDICRWLNCTTIGGGFIYFTNDDK